MVQIIFYIVFVINSVFSQFNTPKPSDLDLYLSNLNSVNVFIDNSFDPENDIFLIYALTQYFTDSWKSTLNRDIRVYISRGSWSGSNLFVKDISNPNEPDSIRLSFAMDASAKIFGTARIAEYENQRGTEHIEQTIFSLDLYKQMDNIFLKYYSRDELVKKLAQLLNYENLETNFSKDNLNVAIHVFMVLPTFVRNKVVIKGLMKSSGLIGLNPNATGLYKHDTAYIWIKTSEIDNEVSNKEHILYHEYAHAFYFQEGNISAGKKTEWENLFKNKLNGYVSEYASTDKYEDFAESFAFYMVNPTKLKNIAQQKYNFIKENVFSISDDTGFNHSFEYSYKKADQAMLTIDVLNDTEGPVLLEKPDSIIQMEETEYVAKFTINTDMVTDQSGFAYFTFNTSSGESARASSVLSMNKVKFLSSFEDNAIGLGKDLDINYGTIYDRAGNSTRLNYQKTVKQDSYLVIGNVVDTANLERGKLESLTYTDLYGINITKTIETVQDTNFLNITLTNLPKNKYVDHMLLYLTWQNSNKLDDVIAVKLALYKLDTGKGTLEFKVPIDKTYSRKVSNGKDFTIMDKNYKLTHIYVAKNIRVEDDLLPKMSNRDSITEQLEILPNSFQYIQLNRSYNASLLTYTMEPSSDKTVAHCVVSIPDNLKIDTSSSLLATVQGPDGNLNARVSPYVINGNKIEFDLIFSNVLKTGVYRLTNLSFTKEHEHYYLKVNSDNKFNITATDYVVPAKDAVIDQTALVSSYDDRNNVVSFSINLDKKAIVPGTITEVMVGINCYDGTITYKTCQIHYDENNKLVIDSNGFGTPTAYVIDENNIKLTFSVSGPTQSTVWNTEAVYSIESVNVSQKMEISRDNNVLTPTFNSEDLWEYNYDFEIQQIIHTKSSHMDKNTVITFPKNKG